MHRVDTSFRALGSPCTLSLYGPSGHEVEDVQSAARAELERIERKYSRYRADSVVSQINEAAGSGRPTPVDAETRGLLDYAATAFEQSGGLFDITSGILRRAWDFEKAALPEAGLLEQLCGRVGWQKVHWQDGEIALPEAGMELDFGGFGKEYAADRIASLCRDAGLRHGLVDLGGDLCVVGPHPDGTAWQVGIRDPRDPERPMASLPLGAGAIATSGDYERYVVIDGVRYAHLLDPRTGWPVRGLAAVSVVAPHCLVAGTATTVAMLEGRGGERWLKSLGLPHLIVDEDGRRAGSLWPEAPVGERNAAHPFVA